MTPLLVTYATALMLGTLHALEADHMAAVTSFAVRRPGLRESVSFGVRWSIGHGAAILIIGTLLIVVGTQLPESTSHWLERGVGVMMVLLGVWAFRGARALHAHTHSHDAGVVHGHVHSHAVGDSHDHGHAVTAVGLLHGLAGSGGAMLLIPVATVDTALGGILFLVLFGIGTIAGMALWGLIAGVVLGRTAERSVRLTRMLARITGVFTIIIGLVWLFR